MRGDVGVIELLNEVLTAELTSVNQYYLDAKMFETGDMNGWAIGSGMNRWAR